MSVPARNANFTGRDACCASSASNCGRAASRSPAADHPGAGGIGKTQVALEYTHRFRADYDVVWWLNCGQPQYIDASLADLDSGCERIRRAACPRRAPSPRSPAASRHLSRSVRLRWLLVYDNAEEEFDTISARCCPAAAATSSSPHGRTCSQDIGTSWKLTGSSAGRASATCAGECRTSPRKTRVPVARQPRGHPARRRQPLARCSPSRASPSPSTCGSSNSSRHGMRCHPLATMRREVAKAWHLSLDGLERRSPAAYRLLGICSVMAPAISLDLVVSDAMAETPAGARPQRHRAIDDQQAHPADRPARADQGGLLRPPDPGAPGGAGGRRQRMSEAETRGGPAGRAPDPHLRPAAR